MDVIRSRTRSAQIGYHLAEAEAWLAASSGGEHTTPLSYAAFELRLEIERVAVELLAKIRGDRLLPADVQTIRSFDRIEKRIYELEGHQRILDRKISLVNVMLEALQLEWRIQPIVVGHLRSAWQECSELCHVTWSLLVDSPAGANLGREAFSSLSDIQQRLRSLVDRGIAWPQVSDPLFVEVQDRYIRGEIGDADVRAWFAERGLWGQVTHPDGSNEFVGVPIPPSAG
jgi:hypothetical protein